MRNRLTFALAAAGAVSVISAALGQPAPKAEMEKPLRDLAKARVEVISGAFALMEQQLAAGGRGVSIADIS